MAGKLRIHIPHAPKVGQPIRADFLRDMRDAVESLDPARQRNNGDTTSRGLQDEGGGGANIEHGTVTSESANTITVTLAAGSTTVAKPWHLRGAIGTRTVNGEIQVIIPAYVAGGGPPAAPDTMVMEVGEAVTGLTGVEWIEVVPVRHWAQGL